MEASPSGFFQHLRLTVATLFLAGLAACSNGGSGDGGTPGPSGAVCEEAESFDSTFDAIQKVIFESHGCTEQQCHGNAGQGGLGLGADVAYDQLIEKASLGSQYRRVEPGDNDRSYLWLKLAAGTRPGSVAITGAPMPNGLPAISEDELEALRIWIYAGAPRTGTVDGTQGLLDACLPAPKPITIKPLDPPRAGEGVQFVLPSLDLPARSEQEVCFATYYDFTDQVPREMQDPSGAYFRYSGQELRQDPQSHHLVLLYSGVPAGQVHDPSFGGWSCAGGERAGSACEPTDASSCGSGICHSEVRDSVGCIGYGPPGYGLSVIGRQIGGAQAPQAFQQLHPGVFAQIPMKGVVYWSSHGFNLTELDHVLNGRLNFYFAHDQRFPLVPVFEVSYVFTPNAVPFTIETYCGQHVFQPGTRLFGLTSHTHKRGKHFVAHAPDGTKIYENFIYNDPNKQIFDPPLAFDSPDPAERTVTFCGTYNNGVTDDGSPNPETVTRASRVPRSAQITIGACRPIACVSGRIGAPCDGVDDDLTCDSTPGAGDGLCDACRITGGESTENEMFILIGQAYIDERFPQPDSSGPLYGGLASLRTPPDQE